MYVLVGRDVPFDRNNWDNNYYIKHIEICCRDMSRTIFKNGAFYENILLDKLYKCPFCSKVICVETQT